MAHWESLRIPSRCRMFADANCYAFISTHLAGFLRAFGVEGDALADLTAAVLQIAQECQLDSVYESRVHRLLDSAIPAVARDFALDERAAKVFRQIEPHLKKGKTLDFGCGDARVGKLVQGAYGGVTLADIYIHPRTEELDLPFLHLPERGRCPAESDSFNNVLAITVLHHCIDPIATLAEMVRVTSGEGRILFVESVYGLPKSCIERRAADHETAHFLTLTADEQIAVTAFFDHLYNRCLFFSDEPELKISTPYHYMTAEGWAGLFEQHGLAMEEIVPLGLDHAIAPLFHVLLTASKTRPSAI